MSIQVGLEDDLSAMLLDNDVDPEVPEGTEYYLPAGSSYRVTPFSLMKGFRLAGSRDGVKPVVVLEGSWSIASPVWSLIISNSVMKQTIITL